MPRPARPRSGPALHMNAPSDRTPGRGELAALLLRALGGGAGIRLAGMGFSFLVGVLLARGLGTENYGIYGVAMSIIVLLKAPAEFGLPQLLTREVAVAQARQDWGRLKGVLRWSQRTCLLMALLAGGGVLIWWALFGQALDARLEMALLIGIGLIPLGALYRLYSAALSGLQHVVLGQLPDALLQPAAYALLLLLASWLSPALSPGLAMTMGVSAAVITLFVARILLSQRLPRQIDTATANSDARHWLGTTLPMAMTEGMRVLQSQTSILIAGAMLPMSDVGLYRVAVSIGVIVSMPITLFNLVGAPLIARIHAQNDLRTLQDLLGLFALGMCLGVGLALLPFLLAGHVLIELLFGTEFTPSISLILILGMGFLLSSLMGVSIWLLNMTGQHRRVTRASLLSFLFLLASTPLGILWLDVAGAALANAAAYLLWNLIAWLDALKRLRLDASILSLLRANLVRPPSPESRR